LNNVDVTKRRKLNIGLALGMLILYSLYCFVLVPLGISVSNNVMYSDTVLPNVIEIVYDIVEIMAMSLGYAVTAYSIYSFTTVRSWPSMIIFCGLTVFKYVSNLAMDWIGGSYVPNNVLHDVAVITAPLLLEILQYFVVVWIASRVISNFHRGRGKGKAQYENIYPFKRMLDMSNPMMKISFYVAVVIAVTSVLQSIPYYVELFSITGFILSMILSQLVASVIHAVICYFVMRALTVCTIRKDLKRS